MGKDRSSERSSKRRSRSPEDREDRRSGSSKKHRATGSPDFEDSTRIDLTEFGLDPLKESDFFLRAKLFRLWVLNEKQKVRSWLFDLKLVQG